MKLEFSSVSKYMKAIWEAETALGLERSEAIFYLKKADARWKEVKKLLPVSKPAAPVPAAPVIATPTAPMKTLSDYINESNKAKPVIAPPAPKLVGMDAVRASIRADIAASDLKHELPLNRLIPAATTTARPTRKQCEAIYIVVQPSAGPMPQSWSDDEVFAEVTRAAFQAHQRVTRYAKR